VLERTVGGRSSQSKYLKWTRGRADGENRLLRPLGEAYRRRRTRLVTMLHVKQRSTGTNEPFAALRSWRGCSAESDGPTQQRRRGNRPKMLEFERADDRNGDLSGSDHRLRQPEGWRRQDHHRSQSGYVPGPRRRLRSRHRSRPPGQHHQRLRAGSRRDRHSVYEAIIEDAGLGPDRFDERPGLSIVPSSISLAGAEVELAPLPQRERRFARILTELVSDVRLHPAGLPAVARPYSP
jgi:hypothetical protein